jgi:hypothetical protein
MRMPQPGSGPTASGAPASDPTDASTEGTHAPGEADQAVKASQNGSGAIGAPATATSGKPGVSATLGRAAATVRRHWLASALLAGGFVMRLITEFAYHPAIIYIDTLKYLYDAWPGSDPVGYKVPLKMILAFGGDLGDVEFIQHLLGIAIAVTIYLVLIRRGTPRWLAALAMVPVLFDAYELQVEAMIMPDVWFEAMIVLGLAVLLWSKRPTLTALIWGSAFLGLSTGMRQVGEIMIVPAVIFVVVLGGGLRKVLINTAAVVCAFAVAIVLYMGASKELTGHFRISESSSSLQYGRTAAVADCATLNLSAPEKLLCPTKWERAQGPDWLEHAANGPLRMFGARLRKLYPSQVADRAKFVSHFNHAVELHQTFRVIKAVLRDSVKLFALVRATSPGDTPLWRWQFTGSYFPTYSPYVFIKHDKIYYKLPRKRARVLNPAYGGAPQVDVTLARFLRAYQRNGGYTPGPLFLLCVIAGLAGSVLLFARRRLGAAGREIGLACLCFFTGAVAVLGMSDAFEFTWRYQLPAVVTLPPAGALGIAVILVAVRRRREQAPAPAVSERAPELAAPAQ